MGVLRGLTVAPWIVGLARGVLEAVVMAALMALALFLSSAPPAAIVPFAPVLLVIVRWLEGIADQIDPAKHSGPDTSL